MSHRVLMLTTLLLVPLVLGGCPRHDDEDVLRGGYHEALKARDVQGALSQFDELHSRYKVSQEEIFEASWMAFFCGSREELAWGYFLEIEEPTDIFDDIYGDLSVLHLGARLVCSQGSESQCIDYSERVVSYALEFSESESTYLSQYIEEIKLLIEMSRSIGLDEVEGYEGFQDHCPD